MRFTKPVIIIICLKSFEGLPPISKSESRMACKNMYRLTYDPLMASPLEISGPTEPIVFSSLDKRCVVFPLQVANVSPPGALACHSHSFSLGLFHVWFTDQLRRQPWGALLHVSVPGGSSGPLTSCPGPLVAPPPFAFVSLRPCLPCLQPRHST